MLSSPRQHPRPESVHSWWSDSNPTGPNINLHAATKPLLRRMHDRQALALIRKSRGSPLSSKDVEIYTSYLWFKYISPSTKIAILRETYERANSEGEALTVANSLALYHVDALLESSNDEFRSWTCLILAQLACHETTVAAVLSINPSKRLVSILQDDNIEVVQSGVYALYCLAPWQEGAQALVDTRLLECTESLLSSGEARIRRWTCGMLARLLQRPPTLADSVVKLFNQLASVLRDEPFHDTALELMESAAHALFWSIRFPEVPQEAILLDCLLDLLKSRNFEVRKWTCEMLGDLACHKVPMIANSGIKICKRLTSLLREEACHGTARGVMEDAAHTLFWIIRFSEGPQEAILLDCLPDLLESRNFEVREWTCKMLGDLASHKPTVPMLADSGMKICKRLASILREEARHGTPLDVMESTLFWIIRLSEGLQEAILPDCLSDLLESGNFEVRKWTCEILARLLQQAPTPPAIADSVVKHFNQLASVLCEEPFHDTALGAMESAAEALVWSLRFPEAPQEAILLDHLLDLLESRNFEVRKWTCEMLGDLACHKVPMIANSGMKICKRLTSLLREEAFHGTARGVMEDAAHTLFWIIRFSEGPQEAILLDCLPDLLESPNFEVREWTCKILGDPASHEPTVPITAFKTSLNTISRVNDCRLGHEKLQAAGFHLASGRVNTVHAQKAATRGI
ncbi:armadillo-type protein [Mycena vulgaris]|nr:armadillo-type protein [Mycena vulgaris]